MGVAKSLCGMQFDGGLGEQNKFQALTPDIEKWYTQLQIAVLDQSKMLQNLQNYVWRLVKTHCLRKTVITKHVDR